MDLFRKFCQRLRNNRRKKRTHLCWIATLVTGILVALLTTGFLENRLRPMVVMAAQAQVQNMMSTKIEHAILTKLEEQQVHYSEFIEIQRDYTGIVTSISTNTAALNHLRAELVGIALETLRGVDVSQIQIPLGSLFDFDLIWGLGPTLKVHTMTVGTADGTFQSDFSAVGINQTCHKIDLVLSIPLTLILPGGAVETVCQTVVPIVETVIVGQVPNVYLQN